MVFYSLLYNIQSQLAEVTNELEEVRVHLSESQARETSTLEDMAKMEGNLSEKTSLVGQLEEQLSEKASLVGRLQTEFQQLRKSLDQARTREQKLARQIQQVGMTSMPCVLDVNMHGKLWYMYMYFLLCMYIPLSCLLGTGIISHSPCNSSNTVT